ncbi:MAG: Abi family protein [Gammaproteobacteria bacterium]
MSRTIPFQKPVYDLAEQVDWLQRHGMSISDLAHAEHNLRFIGFYRLSGYWIPFQYRDNSHSHDDFKPNTAFDLVLDHYFFDRKLRVLIIDALERIEVAARSTISNTMSVQFGPHSYLDPSRFTQKDFDHKKFLERILFETGIEPPNRHKKTNFIRHYLNKYDRPTEPPSWMVFETLPFGSVSFVYQKIGTSPKRTVANSFGISQDLMQYWLHASSHLRNLCAHHSRIWNREFGIAPKIAKGEGHCVAKPKRFYWHAVAIQTMLRAISSETRWGGRLQDLLSSHPGIPIAHMGFPNDWAKQSFWSN